MAKLTKRDEKMLALALLAGVEAGYDGAVRLVQALEEAQGSDLGLTQELRARRDKVIAAAASSCAEVVR